jgi:hypothetical protein
MTQKWFQNLICGISGSSDKIVISTLQKLVHHLGGDYLAVAELFVEVAQHNQVGRGSGHHSRTTYIEKNPELKKYCKKAEKDEYKKFCRLVREQSKFFVLLCFVFCSTFCAEQAEL